MLKTIGAVVLIGAIVIATFLYGNRQRQAQVRKDQAARQQSEQQAAQSGPKVSVDNSKDNTTVKPENQTANKTTTTANTSGQPVAPAPAPAPASGSTPDTGSEMLYLVPAALILGLWQLSRRSSRALRRAQQR